MPNEDVSWTCSECGTALPIGEKVPCQKCGSERRTAHKSSEAAVGVKADLKTYVVRASGNPLADTAYLAVQAFLHPSRTVFVETSPGGEGEPPRWIMRPVSEMMAQPSPPPPRLPTGEAPKTGPKPEGPPTLTPGFNFSLIVVAVLTFVALIIQVVMGFGLPGQATDFQKQLFSSTDWILKVGGGALFGLVGGKGIK